MVFYSSLSDSKSPQVSRTLLSIQADLNDDVVWMVSTYYFQILQSLHQSVGDCTKSTSYYWHHCHFYIPQFFQFPSNVMEFVLLFTFLQSYTEVSRDSKVHNFASSLFFFLLIFIRSGRLAEMKWSVCISKTRGVYVSHSPEHMLGCVYTICLYGQI